jgi:hypothetical protein
MKVRFIQNLHEHKLIYAVNHRIMPRARILGDYHKCEKELIDRLVPDLSPRRSYIFSPVTVMGSIVPYKTEHTMSRLGALFNSASRQTPFFIVSPQLGLSALHFAVAELYESFKEYHSRIGNATPSLLADAPLSFVLQKFSSQEEVNGADNNGWTALHIAALNSNVQAVALLLEAGADPNLLTKSGWTALDCAYVARIKWGTTGAVVALKKILSPPAHAENMECLRKRTNAVIELLEERRAVRNRKKSVLSKVILKVWSREWEFYSYLNAVW